MDSLRYWVTEMHVDGFRFDLASALARELHDVDRLGAFFDIMRQDPVLSQRQADRRAVGPRRRRLPGRQFPGRLGRVERQVPRHDARATGRATAALIGDFARRLTGSSRSLRAQRPPPARQHQLHHRARRLHAARPRQLQRQAQRGQRRGQPRRQRQQPVVELRRRGPTDDPRDHRAARAPDSATCSRRCCSRRACRCCSPATSSAARSAATTTPTARTTRSAGSTGTLDEATPRLLEFARRMVRAAARPSGLPPAALLPGPGAARQRECTTSSGCKPDGTRDDRATSGTSDFARGLGVYLAGDALDEVDARGRPVRDDNFLLLFNAHHDSARVPAARLRRGRMARARRHRSRGRRAARRDVPASRRLRRRGAIARAVATGAASA